MEARPHYQLAMVLGTLGLLVALRVRLGSPARAVARLGRLGGLLGLAFWTNFLSLAFFPPAALLVLAPRSRVTPRGALAAALGFALGSLPHWLYSIPHGKTLPPAGPLIGVADLGRHLAIVGRVAWPIIAGVPEALWHTPGGVALSLALGVLYALALVMAWRAARSGQGPGAAVALALLALVATNLLLAVGTVYGKRLDDRDQRYFLPVFTSLPVFLGAWLARQPARRAAVLAILVLLVHGAGIATGTLPFLAPESVAREAADMGATGDAIAILEREGPRRIFAHDPGTELLTFLSGERVIVADPYDEAYPPYARAVDGAPEIGWWFRGVRSGQFEETLAAMGVAFHHRRVGPLGHVYADFTLAPHAPVELPPDGITATASVSVTSAAAALDRDAATSWSTVDPMRGGEWFQVDLGRPEPVALVRWLPADYRESPRGLRVETSLDGRAWQRRVEVPEYVGPLYWSAGRPVAWVRGGRVEVRMAPEMTRYLRLTQTGSDPAQPWSIRELFVYAEREPAAASEGPDGPTLARAVRAAGVSRLYADHGWGSRVALADPTVRVVPANLPLDAYGFRRHTPEPLPLPPMRWRPGTGALVEPADADGFARTATALSLGYTRSRIGGLDLFVHAPAPEHPGPALPDAELSSVAFGPSRPVRVTAGNRPRGGWEAPGPWRAGDWLRVDLAHPHLVRGVRLWTLRPGNLPRDAEMEGSEDGATWRPIPARARLTARLRWGGITLLPDGIQGLRFDFAPTTLRALRLTLTRDEPALRWSVGDLAVYAAD